MELHELWILCALVPVQAFIGYLIKRYYESPNAMDTYILSDSNGHKIKFKMKRHASDQEHEDIISEKLRELQQLQTA